MSVNGPETPTSPDVPMSPAYTYGPEQSQYVPPLESWPPPAPAQPQAPGTPQLPTAPGARVYVEVPRSLALPWTFAVLGIVIPLSALITAIWALRRWRYGVDPRCAPIAIVAFAITLLNVWVIFSR